MDVTELIKNTLNEIQDLMLTRTVVGDPIEAGDHTVIPVSKVTFGFGGGGGEKKDVDQGQGVGGGWSIEPVGFVIIGPDGARLLTIGEQDQKSHPKQRKANPKLQSCHRLENLRADL